MSEVKVAFDDLRTETSVSGFRAPTASRLQGSASTVSSAAVPPASCTWIGGSQCPGWASQPSGSAFMLRPWQGVIGG